jgi:hypothetical protein
MSGMASAQRRQAIGPTGAVSVLPAEGEGEVRAGEGVETFITGVRAARNACSRGAPRR